MADVAAAPAFKKRSNKASNIRKRPATPPPQGSDSESEYTSDEDPDESGARVKRRRKDGVAVTATGRRITQDLSKSTTYAADRSTSIAANDDATKTATSYDGAAARGGAGSDARATQDDGTYQGAASYGSFIQKNAEAPSRQVGPMKAPSNVRTITTTDFAPDVCKDYKQTGFCGFGDNCKYLHAREDYAHGWQLDREWEKAGGGKGGKAKGAAGGEGAETDAEKVLENIPFACIICKQPYKSPVVTKCGHYFCEKCAMTRYMKEKKPACAACGADTNGTFQIARKLKDLLDKKKRRMEEKEEAEALENEEGSETTAKK